MTPKDPIEELQQKLEDLIRLRKQEEENYGKMLTFIDSKCSFELPQESATKLAEIKDAMNRLWDVSRGAVEAAKQEDRTFWREVAANVQKYLEPFVQQQREFNSLVVHLVNEYVQSVNESFVRIRDFQTSLILYFQAITPMVDTKFRETIGTEDKNIVVNLLKFQRQIHDAARDHADLLYQELDRRVGTLQLDSSELRESMESLQTSLRSLQHLANAIESAAPTDKTAKLIAAGESRYFHFEENFRGSREEIRDKFAQYVEHYRTGLSGPVLDLGCGRGEFLELLQAAGIRGMGVDSNVSMVQSCRQMGLDVSQGDLLEFLGSQKENSLAGVFCSQVLEHLAPDMLMKLLEAAFVRLQPGAPIVVETINIASAHAFLQIYTRDLTHRTPLHPDTLKFLINAFGFKDSRVLFTSPVPAPAQLKLFAHPANETQLIFNQNMAKLNTILYDPQEYAVLAFK